MSVFYVYRLTNKNHTVLYIGMTNNLNRRLIEHKTGNKITFTTRYNLNKLVYFESTKYVLMQLKEKNN